MAYIVERRVGAKGKWVKAHSGTMSKVVAQDFARMARRTFKNAKYRVREVNK